MGLTGTTSWSSNTKSNGTTIQRYQVTSATKVSSHSYSGTSFFTRHVSAADEYGQTVSLDPCGYCWFGFQTDDAGCASLSFHCTGATRQSSGNKLYCRLSNSDEWSKSGGVAATYSSGWKYTFSEASLLPNTWYYLHIWGYNVTSYGTMTITGFGTYGEPGDIIAPDVVNFNDPIDMSFGSATDGGRYTVDVQVGSSDVVWIADTSYSEGDIVQYNGLLYKCLDDHVSEEGVTPDITATLWQKVSVTLQNYTDPTIPAEATGTVESETITLDSIDSDIFKSAVDNESGSYEFSYAGTDWYLSDEIVDLADYGVVITGAPEEGDIISVDFAGEILGGATKELTWTPLLADYANDNHTSASVPCLITVDTYFGTTLSGTRTKTVTVSFTAAQVGPIIDNTVFTIAPKNEGVISEFNGYIQNYSAIRAMFNDNGLTLKYGATIAKWSVKFGGLNTIDISDGTTVVQDSNIISETTTVVLTLTDSRGFTASTTLTATIIPYQFPTFTATVIRCDGSGIADDAGTYVKVTLNAIYADVNSQNTLLAQAHIKLKSDETYGTPITITGGTITPSDTNNIYEVTSYLISGFLDRVYDVKLVITDALQNTSVLNFVIQSQEWALHIRSGGNGAAFGKVSERDNELDIGDWNFRCGSIINNNTGAVLNFELLASKLTFHDIFMGETSVTTSFSGNIEGATADQNTFINAVNKQFGTYIFSYDGQAWSINNTEIDLEDYGIEIEGIAFSGDAVQVIFASAASGFEKYSTASATVNGNIEDVTLDKDIFENLISESGTYVFSFDGTDWNYDGVAITIADYGLTVIGTAADGDTITVVYTKPKYKDYPYRAAVALPGVIISMIPEVIFGMKDATSGIFAPVTETYDGGVYLYASDDPGEAFMLPTIICWAD